MAKSGGNGAKESQGPSDQLFTIKKWNAVALWSWDVECDTCAICRIQVMGKYVILLNFGLILLCFSQDVLQRTRTKYLTSLPW